MKKTNKKGFTLVELVIVIAVIAILAGVLIGTFASVISRANQNAALQKAKAAVDEAYVEYVAEYHKAPTSIKVTQDSKKFVSVEFGGTDITNDDIYADYVELSNNGYVALNEVNGQEVFFNWSKTENETNYSIDTKSEGTKLTTKVKTYMQDVVDKAIASITGEGENVYYLVTKDDSNNFESITLQRAASAPSGYTVVTTTADLGKHGENTWQATFTVDDTIVTAAVVVTP